MHLFIYESHPQSKSSKCTDQTNQQYLVKTDTEPQLNWNIGTRIMMRRKKSSISWILFQWFGQCCSNFHELVTHSGVIYQAHSNSPGLGKALRFCTFKKFSVIASCWFQDHTLWGKSLDLSYLLLTINFKARYYYHLLKQILKDRLNNLSMGKTHDCLIAKITLFPVT
jgi:hypothetical protein